MTQFVNHTASEPETSKQGYHTFGDVGSFEVFWIDRGTVDKTIVQGETSFTETGWYWWACFPGCIPDGDAVGPFETSIEAFTNAQESDHG